MMTITIDKFPMDAIKADLQRADANIHMLLTEIALVSRALVENALYVTIGDKASHFKVDIFPDELGVMIDVSPIDDIGIFTIEGTKPHKIVSSSPMYIGSNSTFSMSVSHPGTDSEGEAIEQAVFNAVTQAVTLVMASQ